MEVNFSSQTHDEKQRMSLELCDSAGNPYTLLEASTTMTIPCRRIEALPMAVVGTDDSYRVIDSDFPNADDPHCEALILITDIDRERFAFEREGRIE